MGAGLDFWAFCETGRVALEGRFRGLPRSPSIGS